MRVYCDLFLDCQTNDKSLKFLEILDSSFQYSSDNLYCGYLDVCVERLKLIPLIDMLKGNNISYFSVPLYYKNSIHISKLEAFDRAKKIAKQRGVEPIISSVFNRDTPLFYLFQVKPSMDGFDGFISNCIIIDKIDGHVWSDFEYDKYMYDFNVRF